jgi:hypothetical protein
MKKMIVIVAIISLLAGFTESALAEEFVMESISDNDTVWLVKMRNGGTLSAAQVEEASKFAIRKLSGFFGRTFTITPVMSGLVGGGFGSFPVYSGIIVTRFSH